MKLKKVLSAAVAFSMLCSCFAGCGDKDSESGADSAAVSAAESAACRDKRNFAKGNILGNVPFCFCIIDKKMDI